MNESTYLAFELLIGARTAQGYPIIVVDSPAGEGESLSTLLVDDELRDTLAVVEAGVMHYATALPNPVTYQPNGPLDETFLIELGGYFFEQLFSGVVASLYRTSLGMARSQNAQLRIRLRITPPEFAALPWEYLYDAQEDAFLATSRETALVRYIPLSLPVRPTQVAPPLRVLVVIANPQDTPILDVTQEIAILQDALAEWVSQGRVQVEILEQATVAAISQAMRRFQPHVFHFVGHALFQTERAYIVLEDEAGATTLVDERAFREFFTSCKATRLVVLNACQSATLSTSQSLVGLAPRLLQRQLSAVVAMQYPILDQAALIFTREFYRSLALGYPVDAAISEARKGIFLEMGSRSPAWGTPVLFLRAKDGLLFQVEKGSAAATLEIPPPPEPTKPPEILGFVGRDEELTYFANQLAESHLAVIAGMAGVGKTALAAMLINTVAREPSRVFWHSFHEGAGVDAIIWHLAGFLAWHGQDDLWKLLQSTRLTGSQPPPLETLFDYLLQLVRNGNYLLCFDDFHHVDDDPVLNQLIERLRAALAAGQLSIIITSRRVPEFVSIAQVAAVQGLREEDAQRLLQTKGVQLTQEQVNQLYALTGGNAEFLLLAIDALQNAREPQALIERLAESDDIERYLIREVDDGLTGQERAVMNVLAVLLGYAATRDAIEALLDQGNLFRTLHGLTDRHLLLVQETDAGRTYRQHDLVRSFYYEMNSRRARREIHLRAGEYYRDEENDLLLASIHYERAGAMAEAARLATQDVWAIVNRGQIRQLRNLLERFSGEGLDVERWIEVNLAKGQIYTMQAEGELAEASLQTALRQVELIADTPQQRILAARACRGMGELLEEKSPRDALKWLEQGLGRLQGADQMEEAALYIRSGTMLFFLNHYKEAIESSERGMKLLLRRPTRWHTIALRDQSGIYIHLGDFGRSVELATQAIAMSKQLSDPVNIIDHQINLAIATFSSGDIDGGFAGFAEAEALAKQTGNNGMLAAIEMNLGTAYFSTGELESAKEHLHNSLQIATEQGNSRTRLYALRNLIDLHVDKEEWEVAIQYLNEAEPLARALDDQHNLMTIFGLWCEVKLVAGDVDEALEFAKQRFTLAIELQEMVSQGISQAFLGKALVAKGSYEEAFIAFTESLTLIGDEDPYQVALTKMDWGKALLAAKQLDAGIGMLIEAQQELRELENRNLVEQIDALLATYAGAEKSPLNKEMNQ